MCDYIFTCVRNASAEVAGNRWFRPDSIYDDCGFASLDNLQVAVCLRPGPRSHSRMTFKLMA